MTKAPAIAGAARTGFFGLELARFEPGQKRQVVGHDR